MNATLFAALLHQRARSPARVALALATFLMPLLPLAFVSNVGLAPLRSSVWFAYLMATGLIGQEYSSGTLHLVLARPVTRASFALSRWLAAALGACCLAVVQLAIGVALLSTHGGAPESRAVALFAAQQVLAIFGTTSVLLLFSSLLPGVGDFFAVWALGIVGGAVTAAGKLQEKPWLARAGEELQRFGSPTLDLNPLFWTGPVSWFEITSYLSTVTLCLALAIVILNRREISYAAG